MVRQTDTAWHKKVYIEDDVEMQERGALELVELQDVKLQEVQEKSAAAGVNVTLEVRRSFRRNLRNVGSDDDDDDDDDDDPTKRNIYAA